MSEEPQLLLGDALEQLRLLPDACVHTCITSPPYYGLRDYGTAKWEGGDPACDHLRHDRGNNGNGGITSTLTGKRRDASHISHSSHSSHSSHYHAEDRAKLPYSRTCAKCGAERVDKQIGLEETPWTYVNRLVEVFREVRRILRPDGTLWLNLGDSYATGAGKAISAGGSAQGERWTGSRGANPTNSKRGLGIGPARQPNRMPLPGLKPKDLIGVPWRMAFALQEDGWWLRSDIIWAKRNPMPESMRDRPTRSHEYLFLLAKSERYHYDYEAIMEPCESGPSDVRKMLDKRERCGGKHKELSDPYNKASERSNIGRKRSVGGSLLVPQGEVKARLYRNRRTVWTLANRPYKGAHFATFPPALITPCILAGSPIGGTVLDPFAGSGTTIAEALRLSRRAIGIELNADYLELIKKRVAQAVPIT